VLNVPIHMIAKPAAENLPVEMPESPDIYYCLASNGIFKRIKNPYYSAIVNVDGVGHLAELKESAEIFAARIPETLFRRIEAFFADVYETHKSEAAVVLFYNPEVMQWDVSVPVQEVQGASVKYDIGSVDPPVGFSSHHRFGSIHSHAAMSAFFSATDDHDEMCFDGPHVVIGCFDKLIRTYATRWMLAGQTFKATLEDIVEGVELPKADPTWAARVKKPAPTFVGKHWSHENGIYSPSGYAGHGVFGKSGSAGGAVENSGPKLDIMPKPEVPKLLGTPPSSVVGSHSSYGKDKRFTSFDDDDDFCMLDRIDGPSSAFLSKAVSDGKLSKGEADEIVEEIVEELSGFGVDVWP